MAKLITNQGKMRRCTLLVTKYSLIDLIVEKVNGKVENNDRYQYTDKKFFFLLPDEIDDIIDKMMKRVTQENYFTF